MIYVLCPGASQRPSGGRRRLYHHVDVLNDLGFEAAVLHGEPGQRLRWFDNQTRVVHAPVRVGADDLLVIPEYYGDSFFDLAPGVPRVLVNLNVFHTRPRLADPRAFHAGGAAVRGVICNSAYSETLLRSLLPDVPVWQVPHGIDESVWFPDASSQRPRIAHMPRKGSVDSSLLFGMLESRGSLEGWEVVTIHDMTEAEVAATLRSSMLFVSLGLREGFGRPPAEAVACGCSVVGYHGVGGEEIFRYPSTRATPNGDVLRLAEAVEAWLHDVDAAAEQAQRRALQASVEIRRDYSEERERAALQATFRALTEGLASRAASGTRVRITGGDVLRSGRRTQLARWARRLVSPRRRR